MGVITEMNAHPDLHRRLASEPYPLKCCVSDDKDASELESIGLRTVTVGVSACQTCLTDQLLITLSGNDIDPKPVSAGENPFTMNGNKTFIQVTTLDKKVY